ncbi:NUDIX domain-containing protein [Legionella pneumophila]|uniref:MutT/nudix family protein n=1 Tax=Legionella pneumophila subsp. pascullei TaxID=91890 RepID=A0AAX2IWC7_LEGPN|nr:NUDIX domain-containing protein [Legionella pneumophila]AMP89745.1 DNA mismatch repair protein MutT [Legionella pneumophila subsp. pascullei]AMP92589.1 DNA mismatch repair protein MutT [Legionella pneumophila subsp. pascullei]AMP95554.1 DNA mismatch repair protein MutT [Legionella pneumophila subsp. pascullei]SQG90464.1 MutT/nudix family protein [Legionella pneumophila subsp. pascullei]VEH06760.1 MutT/nudix family protein [Legionella pneumophila subsp. pascullei]
MKINNIPYYVATRVVKRIQSWLGLSTLGARAIVINTEEQVLLVKHTYQPHWYLPGGGVKKGESPKAAVIRELQEEVGIITAEQDVILFGIYHHKYLGVNDYPVIYIVKKYTSHVAYSREIEQMKWFRLDTLPEMVSQGTKRRLVEYINKNPISEKW